MGMILAPILFFAFIISVVLIIFLLLKLSSKKMYSYLSIPIGGLISFLLYQLVLNAWSNLDEFWITTILVPININIILPGVVGLMGIFIPKDYKVWNVVGFAFAFSVIFSVVAFIINSDLLDASTFFDTVVVH